MHFASTPTSARGRPYVTSLSQPNGKGTSTQRIVSGIVREKAAQKSLLPREETLTSTTRATESKMLRNTDFLMPWLLSPRRGREKLKWRGECNFLIMNSTGKPSNPSKPVDNFWHSIIPSGTCHATTATTQKIIGRNGERLRTCK